MTHAAVSASSNFIANIIIIALLPFHAQDDWVIAPNTRIEVQ